MIKSMTAYARAENQTAPYTVRVEVRSYNSRHLDVALKLTHGFEVLEEQIKGGIADTVARGRVDIRVQILDESEAGIAFEVNLPRARAYCEAVSKLNQSLGLEGKIATETVLGAGSIVLAVEVEKDMDPVWPLVSAVLNTALSDLDAMRRVEGTNMAKDFYQRLDTIETMLDQISAQASQLPSMYQQRLKERIEALTHGIVEMDQTRIAQEAALLADRSDISEEIVRARSHIQQFRTLMEDGTPAGRPLNFLLQEFNREFNTMGSKSGKANMSHIIVAVKSELEKLREQVQNVE
ncbi:MAG: YicC family protein [Desulfosarcina sp.]|nr:YicC family protein [Desulfosarcina sp.]MBC2742470.1 YicC family protein [Desulfosarcina sp.]MBC2765380.1 YicC family protein [Desulfosarcina sp.]